MGYNLRTILNHSTKDLLNTRQEYQPLQRHTSLGDIELFYPNNEFYAPSLGGTRHSGSYVHECGLFHALKYLYWHVLMLFCFYVPEKIKSLRYFRLYLKTKIYYSLCHGMTKVYGSQYLKNIYHNVKLYISNQFVLNLSLKGRCF